MRHEQNLAIDRLSWWLILLVEDVSTCKVGLGLAWSAKPYGSCNAANHQLVLIASLPSLG